jgi:exosortase A
MGDVMPTPLRAADSALRQAGIIAAIYTVAVLLLYRDSLWSMISIWNRSDTYAHGYLIVPISLWLVWNKRHELAGMRMEPDLRVALLLLPAGLGWLLAALTDVLVVQQLALVSILIVGLWALLGHSMSRVLMFPLAFLLLAVPMGEGLVPPMMELTASSTVWLVKATGIPVYREGLYFSLPSGNWSVVEACSGVRYLIASFTLGLLYAHLTYRSIGRRLLFVLASILVPIAANSARAYIIVMLGHLSGMKLATGVDHLVYGWVFFGLVMMILFWIGSFWREDQPESPPSSPAAAGRDLAVAAPPVAGRGPALALVATIALAAAGPLFAALLDRPVAVSEIPLEMPAGQGGWSELDRPAWHWQPIDRGANATGEAWYSDGDETVSAYLQQFVRGSDAAELVSGRINRLIDDKGPWKLLGQGSASAELGERRLRVREVRLGAGERELLLWYWYRVGDRYTASDYRAKAYEALESISFGRRDSAMMMLATMSRPGVDSRAALQGFLQQHLAALETALDQGVSSDE